MPMIRWLVQRQVLKFEANQNSIHRCTTIVSRIHWTPHRYPTSKSCVWWITVMICFPTVLLQKKYNAASFSSAIKIWGNFRWWYHIHHFRTMISFSKEYHEINVDGVNGAMVRRWGYSDRRVSTTLPSRQQGLSQRPRGVSDPQRFKKISVWIWFPTPVEFSSIHSER